MDKPKKLTPRQKLFCELYAEPGVMFGNGVQAYIEAYNIDTSKPGQYNVAKVGAFDNLTNPNLLNYIRELMELGPLSDEAVDRELAFVIAQNADLGAKVRGIHERNVVKGRIINKTDISSKGERVTTLTPEIIAAINKSTGHAATD
jgi:hypothetical protein